MNETNRRDAVAPTDSVAIGPQSQHTPALRFPTITGESVFDPDGFFEDVFNAVNDLTIGGFNSMEKQVFAAQTLDLKNDEARRALKLGVDRIYKKVQDSIDENLSHWESICRDRYFNFPAELRSIGSSQNNAVKKNLASGEEDFQALDVELTSLRSQLIAVHKEGAKMRRELTSLEKQLVLQNYVLSDLTSVKENEVLRSASCLRDTILKASGSQDSKLRQQTGSQREPTLEDKSKPPQGLIMPDVVDLNVGIGDAGIINLL